MSPTRKARPQVKKRPPEPVPPPGVLALRARSFSGRLSNYELAPLVGVHHDDLTGALDPNRNSIAALIALSRHADLHPADLIADLEPLMRLRRLEPEPTDTDVELDALERDAAMLLSALTLARGPVSPGALATVFGWSAERTADALDFITENPELAGPLALRHAPNGTFTLTPRLDLLTVDHRRDLDDVADADAFTFTAAHSALLVALMSAPAHRRESWRTNLHAEHDDLVALGVLYQPDADDPGRFEINPDVLYSLGHPGTD